MVPLMVGLAGLDPRLALATSAGLWLLAFTTHLGPPAEWWSERTWFFNPLSWQLLFYTGFAFASGWLRTPPASRQLTWLALALVLVLAPVSPWWPVWRPEALQAAAETLWYWEEKQYFGPLRLLHFLALAYLALQFVDRFPGLLAHPLAAPIVKVGQQALPVFLTSIILAQAAGILLDLAGRGSVAVAAVNLGGFAVLVGVAYLMAHVKAEPWRRPAPVGGAVSASPARPDPREAGRLGSVA